MLLSAIALLGGCDQGTPRDSIYNIGLPIHYTANIGVNTALPANVPIQLAFDRLLLPVSVNRQSFPVDDMNGNFFTTTVAYDPVSRVVSIKPMLESPPCPHANCNPFQMGSSFRLQIVSPAIYTDPSGLHAIDGATLDPTQTRMIVFSVAADMPMPPAAPTVDFCNTIVPIFQGSCIAGSCHLLPPSLAMLPAAGLVLFAPPGNTAAYVQMTAIGRPSVEANTGALSQSQPPNRIFPSDMPIIDANGDPANSFLLYKMLMAEPQAEADGGAPFPPSAYAGVTPYALSDSDRIALANIVPGREMPFPTDPSVNQYMPQAMGAGVTLSNMENISFWIAQGANVPAAGCP